MRHITIKRGVRCIIFTTVTLVLASVGGEGLVGAAQNGGCSNERLREHEAYALNLPDCRAYEQVSPVDKGNADALGAPGFVQASPHGDRVTFFSLSPFPTGVAGSAEFPTYLGTRSDDGWFTQGLLPESAPNSIPGVVALTEDLSKTIIFDYPSDPPLTPEATSGQLNYYLRDNATDVYRLLAPSPGFRESFFADATVDDSRILFESKEPLLKIKNIIPGKTNLYEWYNGHLSVVDILPAAEGGEVPEGGAVAGAGASTSSKHYTQHTISEDGTRVYFTDLENGCIYVRENGETTVPISNGPGHFWAATPDGKYVFYTDEAGELWRFDVDTQTKEALASSVGGAIGVLGASNDGSYIYFVNGANDLYEWHEGTPSPTLIAGLTERAAAGVEGARGDEDDWVDGLQDIGGGPAGAGGKSSLVTPDGKVILFFKGTSLFLYEASSGTLKLIVEGALLGRNELEADVGPIRNPFLTRNLSEDGTRVFFQDKDALVPQDTNGVMDVYEWEREGSGACQRSSESFRESSDGCIYLITTGQSSTPSYFGDASTDGNNIFFFTRQSLVGQDQDNNVDIYDARAEGGIASQNAATAVPCTGEICLGSVGSPPMFSAPSSMSFSGQGNLAFAAPVSATKPKTTLTGVRKLAKALKACKARPGRKRAACEARAKKRYGTKSTTKNATHSIRAHKTVSRRHP